jgi:hypothetical protein
MQEASLALTTSFKLAFRKVVKPMRYSIGLSISCSKPYCKTTILDNYLSIYDAIGFSSQTRREGA